MANAKYQSSPWFFQENPLKYPQKIVFQKKYRHLIFFCHRINPCFSSKTAEIVLALVKKDAKVANKILAISIEDLYEPKTWKVCLEDIACEWAKKSAGDRDPTFKSPDASQKQKPLLKEVFSTTQPRREEGDDDFIFIISLPLGSISFFQVLAFCFIL